MEYVKITLERWESIKQELEEIKEALDKKGTRLVVRCSRSTILLSDDKKIKEEIEDYKRKCEYELEEIKEHKNTKQLVLEMENKKLLGIISKLVFQLERIPYYACSFLGFASRKKVNKMLQKEVYPITHELFLKKT